jgi:hypothetical protein
VCTATGTTGERVSICSQRYRSLKKLQKEKDSTPPKGNGDCAEMVKRMANTQPVSTKKLVKRKEKPKG